MDLGRLLRPMVNEAIKGWATINADAYLKIGPLQPPRTPKKKKGKGGNTAANTPIGSATPTRHYYAAGPLDVEWYSRGPNKTLMDRMTVTVHLWGTLTEKVQAKYFGSQPESDLELDIVYDAIIFRGTPVNVLTQRLRLTALKKEDPHAFILLDCTRPKPKSAYRGRTAGVTDNPSKTERADCVVYFEAGAPEFINFVKELDVRHDEDEDYDLGKGEFIRATMDRSD